MILNLRRLEDTLDWLENHPAEAKPMATDSTDPGDRDDEHSTLCENCDREVPVSQTHSCPWCGMDPLCPDCVCEDCPGPDPDTE